MVHRKIKHKIVGYICLCMLVLFACKKEAKEPIFITMTAIQAHNNQPVPGIKWEITESKGGGLLSEQEITDRVLNGETDQNGISVLQFLPLKNKSYQYDIYFDYANMHVPSGEYTIVSGPPSFAHVYRGPNNYNIRILPKMDVQINFKNETCFGPGDTFRYKIFNIDEQAYLNQDQINSTPWLEGASLNGCVNFTGPFVTRLAGHYIFYWEAVRNGILEADVDTFYVSPDGNNLIEMFW